MASPKLDYARHMLTGEAEPREDIPCASCGQYAEMRKSAHWLTQDEIRRHSTTRYTAGVLLRTDPSIRFAQVSVLQGSRGQPRWERSGRLFRFGVDKFIYFAPPKPGTYTIFVRPLTSRGWGPAMSRSINFSPRPPCQEFRVDVEPSLPSDYPEIIDCLPLWIR